MSVNGDSLVVRNGRSTSQVSVYNYPEHLNPFYEDDNHKRLRFWKINKGAKDGQGRRNSFSLAGLKDMWAFKSFRMKKKSSTLGINKTSESPPQMRRDIFVHENGYSTYDPRMRYTTAASNGDKAFQRNVPYRSSLQDMRSEQTTPINGIGLNRNDRYRSTIQTATTSGARSTSPSQSLILPPARRYVYRGSVTPQPVRNNDFNSDSLGMISRGSSQASVASTNPFDDEDDDEDVVVGGNLASKHPARKKRRAPPPPVPVHQIITEESSSASSTPSHKPCNAQEDERVEIHNLTAEIESFVKLSNSDNPERKLGSSTTTTTTTSNATDISKSPKQNGTIPKAPPAKKSNGTVSSNVDIIIATDAEPLFISEDKDLENNVKNDSPVKSFENTVRTPVKEVGHVEAIHVHLESPRSSPEKTVPSRVSTFRSERRPDTPENNTQRPSTEKAVIRKTVKVVKAHKSAEESVDELIINESPEKPTIAAKPNISKSPPSLSPKKAAAHSEVNYPLEPPDTPAMRRREIKIKDDLHSTPEMNNREVVIDAEPKIPAAKPQEVTIKITRVITTTGNSTSANEMPCTSDIPVPAFRDLRPQTSPLPAARKVIITDGESNLSKKQEPKAVPAAKTIEDEKKISNLNIQVPTTFTELQLQISESEENLQRVEETTTTLPVVIEASQTTAVSPVSNSEVVKPPPIEKPPRIKHFEEETSESIYRPRPRQWKQSTLAPLEPVPPEKRRSVKQIIESINRSQQLLNGRKVGETDTDVDIDGSNSQRNMSETNTNAMEQNLKSLAESQREMKRMLEELEGLENANEHKLSNKNDENFQGILDTIVSTLARETAKKNDTDIFKKCTITKEVNNASRESSPTSSNLDWNPVPKPKRTKNRSPDLEVKKNNNN